MEQPAILSSRDRFITARPERQFVERSHNEHGALRHRAGSDTAKVPVGHPLCEGPWIADEAAEFLSTRTSCPSGEETVKPRFGIPCHGRRQAVWY